MDLASLMGGGGGMAAVSPTSAAIGAVGGMAQAALGGGAASGDIANRSPVHVAPIGVNLGAILQPFNAGSPENGGYGMELMNRWAPKQTSLATLASTRGAPMNWPLIIGAVAVVGLGFFVLKKKRMI